MKKEDFMRKAIELSIENVKNGGGPFGAVIVKDGEIVATGVNRVTANHDPTAHAEVSDRNKAMEELLPDEAIAAFQAWEEKADKVEY